jgi:hypothetical protein
VAIATLTLARSREHLRSAGASLLAMLVVIAIFVGLNLRIYGHPLGPHSRETLTRLTAADRLLTTWSIFRTLTGDFLLFMPTTLFVLGAAMAGRFLKRSWPAPPFSIVGMIAIVAAATIPFVVPSEGGTQWGPRFMLALVPLVALLAALLLASPGGRRFSRGAFVLTALAGAVLNCGIGVTTLARDYRERVLPALRGVRERPEELVVVSHQFVAQELSAAMADRAFLRCETDADMERLAPRLREHGVSSFLFILAVYDPDPVPGELTWNADGVKIMARLLDRFGDHYFIYAARVAGGTPE